MEFYDDIRILQHAQELEKIEAGHSGDCTPLHVRLELTETCNFRCRFCWWHDADLRRSLTGLRLDNRTLPRARALGLIDELARAGTKAVSFTGTGDPLMYPHLEEVLERLLDRGLVFGFTSNFAVPRGGRLFALLAQASWLRLSLNAGTAEVYRRVHNPGGVRPDKAFGRMQTNARRLAEILAGQPGAPDFNASFVVSRHNREDIVPAARLARDLGLLGIAFRADTPPRRREEPYAYTPEDLACMDEAAANLQGPGFQVHRDLVRQYDGVLADDPTLCCYYSNHTTYIDARGDVYPCCYSRYDARFAMGNVLHTPFDTFWNAHERRDHYRRLLQNACPPCYYGRFNTVLQALHQKRLNVSEVLVVRERPDPFV